MQHQLKIDSRNLRLIMSGSKTFEIINNDKDFKEGDIIEFVEINPPGRTHSIRIGYVITLEHEPNLVVLSLLKEEK